MGSDRHLTFADGLGMLVEQAVLFSHKRPDTEPVLTQLRNL